ncbi:uncharacterized protein LOC103938556 [Pyrus x bretschneideri]|uniref:uncharacterized protein LOC103938556 n=1 Tax=Pyrus x bretschneideri TaxID=225117 RepID=UPI002030D404|nr:uncharacterized protein LOC103938556 [Pyrus x bretschneideri]
MLLMEKVRKWRRWGILGVLSVALLGLLFFFPTNNGAPKTTALSGRRAPRSVTGNELNFNQMLTQQTHNTVELNIGIVRLTFSNPGRDVIGIEYKGIDNLLEIKNLPSNRGYWDLVLKNGLDRLQGTTFKIVTLTADQIEISFNKTYDVSLGDWTLPLNVYKRRAQSSVISNELNFNKILIHQTQNTVELNNGIVRVKFSNPGGDVIGIQFKGIDNVLETKNHASNSGYWDLVWENGLDRLQGTTFKIVTSTADQIEISFNKTYDVSLGDRPLPLNVDKRYIMQRGRAGFYAYAIYKRLQGWPALRIGQTRLALKLRQDKFQFMAISDDRQRFMPTTEDRSGDHARTLAYREAVLLTNPSNPEFKEEVDDKYQYSSDVKDIKVHGWISTDDAIGLWMITPSTEFRTAGPFKQELTSHVGPTALTVFLSGHYVGKDVGLTFADGEAWKKVFRPVFVYLNSDVPSSNAASSLWENAKEEMCEEIKSWPYNFTQSEDYPSSDERGSVTGLLLIRDSYINESLVSASYAYVGLAASGDAGSWQTECKGYQFWTQAENQGCFYMKDVRPGNYSLYATVPGFIGDYKYEYDITIEPASEIKLINRIFEPPRNGPTLWEIGIPDRSAAEFNIPDPYPSLVNRLFTNNSANKFRQDGLWERYEDYYPNHDLIYTIGTNNYSDDWFYAHVTRNINGTYEATTWQIVFQLENVWSTGNYTLQLALASATYAELQVRFKNQNDPPHFSTGLIGRDNAIARHGIHGLYWFFSVDVASYRLQQGYNTIYLTQSRNRGPFAGLMYDYIRLEEPPPK